MQVLSCRLGREVFKKLSSSMRFEVKMCSSSEEVRLELDIIFLVVASQNSIWYSRNMMQDR